jgi:acyl carrier protein
VTGELFISSLGLAQGYLNRPSLTADRFIPNPFANGQRMYRTGDLCRRLPSGDLEYLGRQDEQVKFHGYRIELNEIRYALKKHPQIRDSVLLVARDRNANDILIAYYVSRQELEVSPLRLFLSERLIQETVPNLFIHIEKIPLTLNGKINYGALPSLEEAMRMRRTYVPPRTDDEKILAEIWAEVLGLEQVGISDDFFELGGHSLLATQVTARARESFQVELPMTWLFEAPTVADLAQTIELLRREQKEGPTDKIERADRGAAEEILAKLDQLPDEKIDMLLNSMIAQQGQSAGGVGLSDEELDSLYNEILSEEEEVRE